MSQLLTKLITDTLDKNSNNNINTFDPLTYTLNQLWPLNLLQMYTERQY